MNVFGRIIWVGEWSGPFEALPQGYKLGVPIRDELGNRVRNEKGHLQYERGEPLPRQPKVVARHIIGVHDGLNESVLVLNNAQRRKLLQALFGDFTSVQPALEECVGFYISLSVETKIETRKHKLGIGVAEKLVKHWTFTSSSAPGSSW